ncbi:ribonuclease HII [Fundicoccus culcitae]|uniref:Ribonuclease HII n=1 Tax=Fundicoccus culcitae TaxID=2969821 RepID=A0ABY5P6R3_9LACT|nr:ribonuclease HII [Fundicoccus culcitae]UUX34427.1 ribonuclease HII [Fundicoccus culcitae]
MHKLTLKEIDQLLANTDELSDPLFEEIALDTRLGAKKLIEKHQNRLLTNQQLWKKHEDRISFEKQITAAGYFYIAGVDEVGRGPLAGPVVTAAVILDYTDKSWIGITDSKQLTPTKRKSFSDLIKSKAIAYSIAVVDSTTIDRINIYEATKVAMVQSVQQLSIQPDYLLIDAMTINSSIQQMSLVKGDQRSLSIAAASIIAKEFRDDLMVEYSQMYPEFGFDKHMGYGTKQHLHAIQQYGVTPIHRQSFAPVAQATKTYKK